MKSFNGIRLKIHGKKLEFTEGSLGNSAEATGNLNGINIMIGNNTGLDKGSSSFQTKSNCDVQFRKSDEETDAGQNFVPYFDGTAVIFDQPAPISSIGLIHYTNNQTYAGYIRPIIKSIDYSMYAGNL